MSSSPVFVDDRDPSIVYSPPPCNTCEWRQNCTDADAFETTLTGTMDANVTLTFSFVGTRVAVYGAVPGGSDLPGGNSSYVLDKNTTGIYIYVSPPNSPRRGERILFFNSGPLDDAPHTLVVTNLLEGYQLWMDSIVFTTSSTATTWSPAGTMSATGITTETESEIADSQTLIIPATRSDTLPPTSTTATAESDSVSASRVVKNIRGIAAGAIIGFLALVSLCTVLLFLRKKRRDKARRELLDVDKAEGGGIYTAPVLDVLRTRRRRGNDVSPFPYLTPEAPNPGSRKLSEATSTSLSPDSVETQIIPSPPLERAAPLMSAWSDDETSPAPEASLPLLSRIWWTARDPHIAATPLRTQIPSASWPPSAPPAYSAD